MTALLVWVIARAGAFDLLVRPGGDVDIHAAVVQLGVIGVSVVLGLVVLFPPRRPATGSLGWARRAWIWATGVAVVFFAATLGSPLWLPRHVGSVAVVLLAVAAISGAFAGIVVAARWVVARWPVRLVPILRVVGFERFPAVAFVVIWVLLVELTTPDFHRIEIVPSVAAPTPITLEQAYTNWLDVAGARRASSSGAVPMVLVGAQGGGIRAAVWTAMVMECVFGPGSVPQPTDADPTTQQSTDADPTTQPDDPCAGRPSPVDSPAAGAAVRDEPLPVFLASGASGGSVGLAAWSARRADLADKVPPPPAAERRTGIDTPQGEIADPFRSDFVAPLLARFAAGDITHLFLAHQMLDRAAVLEHALAQTWGAGAGLSRGFLETWRQNKPGQWRVPVLALNGSQVEDGCRFVVSQVDFAVSTSGTGEQQPPAPPGNQDNPTDAECGTTTQEDTQEETAVPPRPLRDVLPRTTELVDYLCPGQDISMATAGHLSARFPFVSPAAQVKRQQCREEPDGMRTLLPKESVSYVLDGGIFDNSGASTALEAWRALGPRVSVLEKEKDTCTVPIFLQIDNSEPATPSTPGRPSEFIAAGKAVFSNLSASQAAARDAAKTEFGGIQRPSRYFQVVLRGQPGPEPPLGWALADNTIDDMRSQLRSKQNKTQIRLLRELVRATDLQCVR